MVFLNAFQAAYKDWVRREVGFFADPHNIRSFNEFHAAPFRKASTGTYDGSRRNEGC